MVKQLERELVPNSRLQSKSREKSGLILTQFEKSGEKTFGRLVLQHLIPSINLSKCVLFKESPNVI